MTHQEKLQWMADYATRHGVTLELEGEVGFGRECVGIVCANNSYPAYSWFNHDTWERTDLNGEIWAPEGAYHKSDCVAVLGRGEDAESQLYDWLVWFDAHGFTIAMVVDPVATKNSIGSYMGDYRHARMVKP